MMHSLDRPNLKCPLCGLIFQQDWLNFNKHFNKEHKSDVAINFPCQVCGANLRGHVDVIKLHYKYHAGLREYACCACDATFMESKTLREHERLHLGTQDLTGDKKQWSSCEHCGKQLLKRNLRYHIESVHLGIKQLQSDNGGTRNKAGQQFSCLVCGTKTKASWFRLVEHFKVRITKHVCY